MMNKQIKLINKMEILKMLKVLNLIFQLNYKKYVFLHKQILKM